jgi:hypothetical protein
LFFCTRHGCQSAHEKDTPKNKNSTKSQNSPHQANQSSQQVGGKIKQVTLIG